jgi:predicted nucleic acid-binding protein
MTRASSFVLDASVALTWLFEDEACPYGDEIAVDLPLVHAIVPDLWYLEIANAVAVGERKNRVTTGRSLAFLNDLRQLPITSDQQPALDIWTYTLGLARLYRLTAYDASYLELAIRKSLSIATLDGPLRQAADRAGVRIHEPSNNKATHAK